MHALSRREFLQLSATATALVALSACAPKPTPTPPPKKEAAPTKPPTKAAAPAPAKKTDITFLCAGTSEVESKHQKHWTEEFNKTNTDNINVKIELIGWSDLMTKQRSYIAAGDAFELAWYCGAAASERYLMGWVEPLDEYLGDIKDTFKDSLFDPKSPNIIEKDGKTHWIGMPFCNYCSGILARRDMIIEKTGMDNNEDILKKLSTYDGFIEVAEKMHNPEDFYAISGPSNNWPSEMLKNNGLLSTADFSADWKDAYITALKYSKKLFEMMPPDSPTWVHRDDVTAYSNGTVGFDRAGTWFYGDIIPRNPDLLTEETGIVVPVPHGPAIDNNVIPVGFCGYFMCSKSKKKEATAKFMHFLATPEVENTFPMNLSPLKGVDAAQQIQELEKLFPGMYGDRAKWWFDQWNAATDRHVSWWNEPVVPSEEVNKIFQDEMVRLFNDETTPEEIYDTIMPQIEEVCKICPRRDGKEFE